MSVMAADREAFAAFLMRMRARNMDDRSLLSAFEAVPRREFIRPEFYDALWSTRMVPIDCGEVIEGADFQAQMLASLEIDQKHRVLEIGTGTGFTAAVLSKLANRVYTIERFRTLHRAAEQRFKALKIDNIVSVLGDGSKSVSDGPFDRIIVWAAFDTMPRHFVELLVSGGVLICAIGEENEPQKLARLTKVGSRFERQDLGQVRMQMLASKLPEIL